jgi:hypothetical protein
MFMYVYFSVKILLKNMLILLLEDSLIILPLVVWLMYLPRPLLHVVQSGLIIV